MIREFLTRLQELQLATLETNVNMNIHTRYSNAKNRPWLAVFASTEEMTEDNEFVGYCSCTFSYYDFQTPEENFERLEKEYNTIEEFINKYKK